MSRLVTILGAAGEVVRGRNAGHWRISRPRWTSTASWLGEPVTPAEPDAGWAEVVRHWLWTFGPGTENDLVWWLGSTRTVIRRALADVDAVPVALDDGSTGWVLVDDTADLETPPSREPWVALLPTLDPTTMGWRDCGFYLDPTHTPYLFDSAGNGGTTVWVNGAHRRELGAGRTQSCRAGPPNGGVTCIRSGCSTPTSPVSRRSSPASASRTCTPRRS